LWAHEAERIYGDRLVSYEDLEKYRASVNDISGKQLAKYYSGMKKFT